MACQCRYVPSLGAIDVNQIIDTVAASSGMIDPDLPQVVGLVREIIAMERRPGGLLDPAKPSTFRVRDLRMPLQTYIQIRRHPWVVYAVPAGLLALAFLLGRRTA